MIDEGWMSDENKIAWLKQTRALKKRREQLREIRVRIHITLDASTA
jgi:hypothetical protein